MNYIITNKIGQIIESDCDSKQIESDILSCTFDFERVFCRIKNSFRRQGTYKTDEFNYYIYSYDQKITNKIFKHYLKAFSILSVGFTNSINLQKSKEDQKTRRLKHNLITHSSNILQELYRLIPQDSFKNSNNHINIIQNIIKSNPKKAAYTYLRVLKNSNLMKAEFDVYGMLETEDPYLDFSNHSIHKVLILTLNPFWLDLVEQEVSIVISQFHGTVFIDYRSISVVLSHIFDNLSKYIMPHSELHISFSEEREKIIIQIVMTSLKIEKDEIENIFIENYSGSWAKKLDLEGDGIGMYIVKKLVKLNEGDVYLDVNYDNKNSITFNNMPYENNRINIELKKEKH